jgi:hypothetical protein
MNENNLMMRIRLESLSKNLCKVKEPFNLINERFHEVDSLAEVLTKDLLLSLEDITIEVTDAKTKLKSMKHVLEKGQNINIKKIEDSENALKGALDNIDSASKLLDKAEVNIRLTLDRCIRIERKPLESKLSNKSDEMISRIKAIYRKLEKKKKKGKANMEGNLFNAWEELSQLTYKESPKIFSEYVDFLRGMALRSTGLDSEICKISDELIKKCKEAGNVDWGSITVPDQREALMVTLAQIIRMGFPEWSIWTLPFAAHEFGHLVASEKIRMPQFGTLDIPPYHMQEYISDAFAVYAMGPSYAYASILMRFDPFQSYLDQREYPSDAKRVYVILKILEKMQEKASNSDQTAKIEMYESVIGGLREEWRSALDQAKIPEDSVDKNEIKQAKKILKCLRDNPIKFSFEKYSNEIRDLKEKLEFLLQDACKADAKRDEDALTEEDRDLLSRLIESLWIELDSTIIGYPSHYWQKSKDLGEKLLSNDKVVPSIGMELRDVLNGAWYIRVEKPSMTERIEKNAEDLMKEIIRMQKKGEEIGKSALTIGGF